MSDSFPENDVMRRAMLAFNNAARDPMGRFGVHNPLWSTISQGYRDQFINDAKEWVAEGRKRYWVRLAFKKENFNSGGVVGSYRGLVEATSHVNRIYKNQPASWVSIYDEKLGQTIILYYPRVPR